MNILLVGLPSSGKSTFIAALWHVVSAQDVPGAIKLHALSDDTENLNRLRTRWLEAQELDHTSFQNESLESLNLTYDQDPVDIVIPDLAGESIKRYLVDRQWPTDFDDYVDDSQGILLFVNPADVFENNPISEAQAVLETMQGFDEESTTSADIPSTELTDSSIDEDVELKAEDDLVTPMKQPAQESGEELLQEVIRGAGTTRALGIQHSINEGEKIPTQVILVDLLQLLVQRSSHVCKVGLVVSAWDLLEGAEESPSDWVARALPLLHQFLVSWNEETPSRIYGVSAQGGRLPDDSEMLLSEIHPSSRIKVVGPECCPHDITAPIRWLITD